MYYVYAHINPETGAIVYLGKGCNERAWGNIKRSEEHSKFLRNLYEMDYIPDEWTIVLDRGLSEKEAYTLERHLIEEIRPIFNQEYLTSRSGENNIGAKLTEAQVREIRKTYKEEDTSYSKLAELYDVSTTAIGRIVRKDYWTHID